MIEIDRADFVPVSQIAPGLTSQEAARRLQQGANVIVDVAQHPVRQALQKL